MWKYTGVEMKKRLFIGVRESPEILLTITRIQNSLKKEFGFPGIRWVNPGLMHITLKFLGDVETAFIPNLSTSLHTLASAQSGFELTLKGLGFFGSGKSLRTIWLGSVPSADLHNLFKEINAATNKLIVSKNQSYSPHITLGRVSDFVKSDQIEKIRTYLLAHDRVEVGNYQVDSFELIESQLSPHGPIYKTIQLFKLG